MVLYSIDACMLNCWWKLLQILRFLGAARICIAEWLLLSLHRLRMQVSSRLLLIAGVCSAPVISLSMCSPSPALLLRRVPI